MPQVSIVEENMNQHAKFPGKRIKRTLTSWFQKHRKKKIAALILAAGAVIAITVFGGQERGILVSTAKVEKDSFEQNVLASGKLEVSDQQEFYAESKTTIQNILVKTGQKVGKDQVILQMNETSLALETSQKRLACEEFRARLVNSESNLRLYQQDYELAQKENHNAKTLFANGAISQKELETAEKNCHQAREKLIVEQDANLPLLKAQLAQAETVYEESRQKLQKATVVSLSDGVVLNLPVKKGQEVEAGTLLVQIGKPENLLIETGVNEIDASQLKIGDRVEITNNALLAEPLAGKIEYVAPIAEVAATSQGEQTQVKVRVRVETGQGVGQLKPGFNVNLKVILQQKDEALLIPYEALVENDGKDLVYVVGQDGIVAAREVQIGLSNELFMEIVSGLEEGEEVVLSPGEQIKDGVKVIRDAAS